MNHVSAKDQRDVQPRLLDCKVLKTVALRTGSIEWERASHFWGRVFGINFVFGVVTGIPMEFQFGTNWARFSQLTGGVIGQALVMEGVFSFFLESAFLGLFLFGEKRLSRVGHWWAGFMVFVGSWLSGYFIIVTDAWMQHPVAFARLADGSYEVNSFSGLLLNPWALLQYAHTMSGAVITGAFVMAAVGAFYLLNNRFPEYGRVFLRLGATAGFACSLLQVFPTGDLHGRYLARHQPVTTAAMEGLFRTEKGAPMVLMGQPDVEQQRIDNPLVVNKVLSYLIYGTTRAQVHGLDEFPRELEAAEVSGTDGRGITVVAVPAVGFANPSEGVQRGETGTLGVFVERRPGVLAGEDHREKRREARHGFGPPRGRRRSTPEQNGGRGTGV